MAIRVGIGLLITGVFAIVLSVFMADGNVIDASFSGWGVLFQGGMLTVFLGVCTLLIKPDTASEVIVVTGAGVLGQLSISLTLLIAIGDSASPIYPLLESVVPLHPMGIGYLIGALRTVPGLSGERRLGIESVGTLLGLTVWIGGYVSILIGYDTTGEGGLHSGFLFIIYVMMLGASAIGGGIIYVLWRLLGPASTGKLDQTGQRSNSADVK